MFIKVPSMFYENKILLLTRAMEELEAEKSACEEEKVRYLGEKIPPLQISGLDMEELQNLVKQMHGKIEAVDEERYDCEAMSGMEGRKKMFAGGVQ
uniref:Troponin I, skeletal, slow c n=1 Tax=Gouania willdenowi TaxID=441366 RepID=A0A8C5DTX9_GOUWI